VKPEREAELEVHQRRINGINREIADLMNQRHKEEDRVRQLKSPPPGRVMLVTACKHLDPSEGPVISGHVVNVTDLSAIATVLRSSPRTRTVKRGNR
jgi:hypothetical protein